MLHILLWILKIIGILLAVLVGILLVLILCVLFVPIRYTVKADGKLGEEQPLHAQVKVSWLLHIVNVAFAYPEAAYLRVRIFCFTVFNSSKKKDRQVKAEEPDKEVVEETDMKADSAVVENAGIEEDSTEKEVVKKSDIQKSAAEVKSREDEVVPRNTIKPELENKEHGFIAKMKAFCQMLKNLWNRFMEALRNIEYTIRKICDRIRKIIENIQYYTDVLKSDVFQRAWQDCKKQLLRIFRMLKPAKCRVNLLIGTGDPGSTGQVWSIYGMLYPWIGNNVLIQTDFDNQIVEGDLYIKGKIKIWVLAFAAFKLFFDKDLRRLVKLLKREEM